LHRSYEGDICTQNSCFLTPTDLKKFHKLYLTVLRLLNSARWKWYEFHRVMTIR